VRADDDADDLEAISPLDHEANRPARVPSRLGRRRKTARTGVCAIGILVVGLSAGLVLGRRESGPKRSVATPVAILGPTHPMTTTTVEPPSTTLPKRGALRTLFTHVSATGAIVIARTGLVSLAAAQECPVTATAPFSDLPGCSRLLADGVQFDSTAPGRPWYRLTVVASHYDNPRLLQPAAGGPILQLRADGSTTVTDSPQLLLAVFRVRAPVMAVRVTLTNGTPELLVPVNGWAAVVADMPGGRFPFRVGVDGLGARGQVVATSQVLRCC
jgi:hypothetical protein